MGFAKIKKYVWFLMKKINSIFFILALRYSEYHIVQIFLKYKNWQSVTLCEISNTTSETSIVLAESDISTVAAPQWHEKKQKLCLDTFPSVLAHIYTEGIVTVYSSSILRTNKLYMPKNLYENRSRILTDSAGLFQIGKRYQIGRIRAKCSIPKGIVIGGAGCFNWYHFIIECLPKAYLARNLPTEFNDFPLIVPDECRSIPSFKTALDLFSKERSIHYLRRGDLAHVGRLIVLDEISTGPFNLIEGEWPRHDDYRQHDGVIKNYITEFRSKLIGNVKSLDCGRRIFLKRPNARRNYNQDELIEIASRYGFEAVSPETLSLKDQAKTFAETSAVIGPSGAAWVGMIFSERPIFGLSWLPQPYEYFCGYSTLANLFGHRLEFIEARTPQLLRSTMEAYTTKYQVCPVEFENGLKKMIEQLEL